MSEWKRRDTVLVIFVIALVIAAFIAVFAGPGWTIDWVKKNPRHPDAGKWLMRAAKVNQYTMRSQERMKAVTLYCETFNDDRHNADPRNYWNRDEYLEALLAVAEAFEDIGTSSRIYYRKKFEDAMATALGVEGVTEDHPTVKEMKSGIERHR
jgi:hypothetical protein